ncbi:MAG: NADH-quinone oxidoreductase subunit C [Chloroflexota bacterium]|jgi:NADH-quinone oxidoreductase subunit C
MAKDNDVLSEVRRAIEGVAPDLEYKPFQDRLEVLLPAGRLVEISRVLRDDLGFAMLTSITAVDWEDRFELVYHLQKLDSPYYLVLRCTLPHEEPRAPTLVHLWAGADFQEREIYDLMGIVFTDHPNLKRILLDDDFPGHPLRKDFQPDPDYVLVRHLRVPGYSGPQGRFSDE